MIRFGSIFNQFLQLFLRTEFEHSVRETRAERHARSFMCWGQFVSMFFCQFGRAHSLQEITGGLRSCEGNIALFKEFINFLLTLSQMTKRTEKN